MKTKTATASSRIAPALKKAADKFQVARLELATAVTKHRAQVLNYYDAAEPNKKRKRVNIETLPEGKIFTPVKRLQAIAIGRDIERNYDSAKGLLNQFKVNVVGSLGKLQVNCKGGEEATEWFNSVWAKDCDFRDPDVHFCTVLQNVITALKREGDLLAVVDDQITDDDSGKLMHYEGDQIMCMTEKDFQAHERYGGKTTKGKPLFTQDSGIIRDHDGKVVAYIVSWKRGAAYVDSEFCTVFPKEVAKLVKDPWRLNQGRGAPLMITAAQSFQDIYEMRAKELQSAKLAASLAGFTKRKEAVGDWDKPAEGMQYLPENYHKEPRLTATDGANKPGATIGPDGTPTGGNQVANSNYEQFESLTGGFWEYLSEGDEAQLLDIKRPNVHMIEFIESVLGHGGSTFGLARCYSLLKADASYTAFRGEMVMTWQSFYADQKLLERAYADWVATKVLGWAQRKKEIKKLPALWERTLSWSWPKMPHVDEDKENSATERALKNGAMDFADLLGPDWEKKLRAFAEQVKLIRKLGLPLSILEAKSGGKAAGGGNDSEAGDSPAQRRRVTIRRLPAHV